MKNTMLPSSEVDKMMEVVEKVNEYIETHKDLEPKFNGEDNQLERIHILLYLHLVKDIIKNVKLMEDILTCSEEDFKNHIIGDGERTLDEFEQKLMFTMLMEAIED